MVSKVTIKTKAELEAMHTGSLMSRRKALLKCEEGFTQSDQTRRTTDKNIIEFKDTPEWKTAYDDLKAVLTTREHVPNKVERKATRQEKAKRGK